MLMGGINKLFLQFFFVKQGRKIWSIKNNIEIQQRQQHK